MEHKENDSKNKNTENPTENFFYRLPVHIPSP